LKSKHLHRWNLAPKEAVVIQRQLRHKVVIAPLAAAVHRVAGVDVSVRDGRAISAVVILSYPELELEEVRIDERAIRFPYVPGLLSFRECPGVLAAFRKLKRLPDLMLVDGHGIAHPRRVGIAAHLGLLLDLATVGCAKSRLCGAHDEPGLERGCSVPLTDDSETIGAVVRTRSNVKPIYISVGNRITLDEAVEHVLSCGGGYRLPEPTRLAHHAAGGKLEAGLR
jgi:deoxyribonuclease V